LKRLDGHRHHTMVNRGDLFMQKETLNTGINYST